MRRLLLALVLCAALIGVGAAPAAADTRIRASGTFGVEVTPTPTFQPLPGDRCLITLPVTLTFAGTLVGTAPGTIRIALDAPCDQFFANQPGTFADVFAFTGTFSGKVAGKRTTATLVYTGVTRPGGEVRGLMALHGGVNGLLTVVARAAAGGSYSGTVTR
jgi:hypothetical protein